MSVATDEQVLRLEREVRSLKRWVLALSVIFAATLTIAATEEPQELTLRKLTLVDREGSMRIQTSGGSVWEFWDAEGDLRSLMGTPLDAASLSLYDRNGNARISIVADDQGSAGIRQLGPKGRTRIQEGTSASGIATIALITPDGDETWSETNR